MPAPASRRVWPIVLTSVLFDLALATALGAAIGRGELPVGRGGTAFLFGSVMIFFLGSFAAAMRSSTWPTVETSWGGLGGGLGGWRISPAVLYLVAALVFGGMLTALSLPDDAGPAPAAQP